MKLNKQKIKGIAFMIIFVLILVFLIEHLGVWGFYGWVTLVMFLAMIRLWQNKDTYKRMLQYCETVIWKKPLEKDYWKKDELKNTKVKVVWGKKNVKRNG